jgi:uncharacterized protein (TIGR01319 family)
MMGTRDPNEIRSILATDCGSTTTKAILIEKEDGGYRLKARGEAPTTVEAPFDDVTVGVLNAVEEAGELSGRKLLTDDRTILKPRRGDEGVDLFISTSSAGGGLQMMVGGVVRSMTAESAERAALGAGAIVMDVIASNDGRLPHEQIERIRSLRPDMILLSGGVDGGTTLHVAALADVIAAADPRPRLGAGYDLPVVYAGNREAREFVERSLSGCTSLTIVDNLRPTLEAENLGPARDRIHDLFMKHVMAQAPGYRTLMSWTDAPIMPTPGAVGDIMKRIAADGGIQVLGVDIGGATTDIFSVFRGVFNRTVSANLGMSYSISNVLASTGIENIARWVPFEVDERELRNRIRNKMIRPTTIPQTLDELAIEHAIAREALGLALEQHRLFARELKGVQKQRTISDTFGQTTSDTLVDMMKLDLLVGSGGVLSHAPRRHQAAMMMLDGFCPEGVTALAVDSIFMMPQLGVLASVHPEAALEVFRADCLIHLGTAVAPSGEGKPGREFCTIELRLPGGRKDEIALAFGEIRLLELRAGESCELIVRPRRGVDAGAGPGREHRAEVRGGAVGLILDGRGRVRDEAGRRRIASLPREAAARRTKLAEWFSAMNMYPRAL